MTPALPFDHDLFTEGPGEAPYYRLVDSAAVGGWDPRAGPDALLLPGDGRWIEVPLSGAAGQVRILTAGAGGIGAKGIAADGELVYADGRTQPVKWMVGEQAWPAFAGATGRGAEAVYVGRNPSGDPLTASLLVVPTSWPDVPLVRLRVHARGTLLPLALLQVETDPVAPPGLVYTGRGDGWYPFSPPGLAPPAFLAPTAADAPAGPGPAGPVDHGPIAVRDGHLVHADGTPARLWGVNLVEEAALPAPDVAPRLADTLAGLGFTLTRLHHVDADGAAANPRRAEPGQPPFLPAALDRLDHLVAELGKRGVYQVLELMTRRAFLPGEGLPSPLNVPGLHKYVRALWPEWQEAERAQARALWGRVNPYTGLRYADDPHVALVELQNEDSLVAGWSAGSLERLPAAHRARLDGLWNAWLRRKYGTDARVAAAWSGGDRAGLSAGETLSLDSIAREPSSRARTELYPTQRAADLVAFLAEVEAAHTGELARFVKEELGFRQPLVCNTSFGVPAADALLAACDVVDLHVYWDPIAESTAFADVPMLGAARAGRVLEELAWCQEGRPCTVSEVQHSWPNRFVQEAPLLWAALGNRQDWDALAWFAWSHGAVRDRPDGPDGALDLEGRWNAWVQLPAAAALFRDAPRPELPTWTRWWSPDGIARDLAEPPGIAPDAVSWPASLLGRRVRTSFLPRPPAPATPLPAAVPGVAWEPDAARLTVDLPGVAAAVGRLADTPAPSPATAGPLAARVATYAAVSLTALDGAPLASSRRALLVAVGRCERDGTVWNPGEEGLAVLGTGEARLERLSGTVWLRADRRPTLYRLDPSGRRAGEAPLTRTARGWWALRLDGETTPWWELAR